MRPNALAKRCSFALCVKNTLCIRNQLATFFTIRTQMVIFIFLCVDCASFTCDWTNLGQRKHNEFRAWALLVPSVRLALVWRSSGVHIHTCGKTLTFLNIQKMCAEVDAHNKWIAFVRCSRHIINEFWRTPSESQRTDQNSSFSVRWTCVMVCVTGP